MDILKKLSDEMSIPLARLEKTVELLDEGNTVPFVARYRKEVTGGLDDTVLRELVDRLTYLRNLEARKEEVKNLIDSQGLLTPELIEAIDAAQTMTECDDIYRPYRPKRKTRASVAREKGLAPLADLIFEQRDAYDSEIEALAEGFVDAEKGVESVKDAIDGACDIIAEAVSDNADLRKGVRTLTFQNGTISSHKCGEGESVYEIYYDFSAYSDMAIGLGKMFGFDFIENFNYPYISRSVVEFWKRWHISLTDWFRQYVYFPLGGNRVSKPKWIRNIIIVWLLTGTWHGAGWNFLLWGLYYAMFMLAERLFLGKWLEQLPNVLRHMYTLFVVLMGWALFAVEDMAHLGRYLASCFGGAPLLDAATLYNFVSYLPMLVILCVAATPLSKNLWRRLSEPVQQILTPILVLAAMVLCTASLVDASYNPFLYFRF